METVQSPVVDNSAEPLGQPLVEPAQAPDPRNEFDFTLLGFGTRARQYVGVGTLNVDTGRGELKAQSGDFIVAFPHFKIVLPAEVFETMARNSGRDDIITYDEWISGKVLNNKSGPDKFTFPMEPIGGERTDGGAPAQHAPNSVGGFSPLVRATTQSKMPGEVATVGTLEAKSDARPEPAVTPPPPEPFGDLNLPSAPLTLDELRAKKARGELLTQEEELRLLSE